MTRLVKLGLSTLSGLLLSLAWPEIGGFTPFIFIALVPLLVIQQFLDKKEWRVLFLYSFLSFIIWHVISDYWMLYSTIIGSITAWVINSFLMASIISLTFLSNRKSKFIPYEITLSFYWLSFEITHLFWELSWPWMNLGNAFANQIEWVQWYEYVGIYGGSFWIIIINGFVFRIILAIIRKQTKTALYSGSVAIVAIAMPLMFSHYLLNKKLTINKTLNISVIQSNFNTYTEKFNGLSPLKQSKGILNQMNGISKNTALCVLPETAIPTNIYEHTRIFPQSIQLLLDKSKANSYSILGSYYSFDSSNSYNTVALIQKGKIIQTRHKSKLVPFAETMPFEFLSKGLKSIIQEEGGTGSTFGRDKFARVFNLNDYQDRKIGALICFESIFPDLVAEMTANGAEFLVIITNDDWWKDTAGHRLHFAISRLHAIANRRPIARAANTGISGFIDAWGRVLQKSKYREKVMISENLESPIKLTFFSQYEKWIRIFILIIAALIFLIPKILTWFKPK